MNIKQFETILVDMDGTLLDLAFDNYFWRELVPRCMARVTGTDTGAARDSLYRKYARKEGSLDWYCLDYWTAELALDLRALKDASSHRIRYLPGAREFLSMMAARPARLVLVTNAHAHTLDVKRAVAGLDRYFDDLVCAHEFGVPKEHARFWPALQDRLDFDPAATLFIDDSEPVLDAAADFGLRGVVAVRRPDTRIPAREGGNHAAVESVAELVAG